MAKKDFKFRNTVLALAQRQDPERFRSRTVESNRRKFKHSRRRQKESFLNEVW